MTPEIESLKQYRGLIATVVTSGSVEPLYAQCHESLRAFNITNGFTSVEYRQFPAALVEAGRDMAVAHMLEQRYDFLVQIDADASFPEDALVHILNSAYNVAKDSDAVGAYAQLKGNFISTTDTGSGTWEPHFPGEGVIPVIRTGGHFLLTKRSAFEKMGRPPWFRTRVAPRALDVMAEIDNFARQKFSGRNPLSDTGEWQHLLEEAMKGGGGEVSSVGEDSGFCDRLTAAGGRIYVDCDLITGHIAKKVIGPHDLIEAINKRQRHLRLSVGVTE